MLKGKAKTDYQREYMRRYRSNKVALDPVRPDVRPKEPDIKPTMQAIGPDYDADGNPIPDY